MGTERKERGGWARDKAEEEGRTMFPLLALPTAPAATARASANAAAGFDLPPVSSDDDDAGRLALVRRSEDGPAREAAVQSALGRVPAGGRHG